MQTISSRQELRAILEKAGNSPEGSPSVGFVPTMGALHAGHAALVRRARSENSIVVVSVFVNPTQFNNQHDLSVYPRTPVADKTILEKNGCDILFLPSIDEMYPDGTDEKVAALDLGGLDSVMEGKFRPGHFAGVVQVVKKLFDVVGNCNAYFGEKDFQQLAIIRRMVTQLHLPVKVTGCATIREADGLAMSSRNTRLSAEERKAAAAIPKALSDAKKLWKKHSVEEIKTVVEAEIERQSILKMEYFEIVDAGTLQPLHAGQKENAVACIAVFAGNVRLIDNVVLG
jgi:pantoate--beta-alanine ligase